jgi:hypothetical protein
MSNTPIANVGKKLDIDKLPDNIKKIVEKDPSFMPNALGIGGDVIAELKPKFKELPFEVVTQGKYDAAIVLGRDRAGQFNNEGGYGLMGETSCAAIDIVVGRKSADEKFSISDGIATGPDFFTDAARIYISQKADIDDYLSIPEGNSGFSMVRSTVAAKADAIRLVGRESIKLVIGTDQKTSQKSTVQLKVGVELMAGDLELCKRTVAIGDSAEKQKEEISLGGMQPIPLGINLSFALDQIIEKIDQLSGLLSTKAMIMTNFINATTQHIHTDGLNLYYGIPAQPSIEYDFACHAAAAELAQYTVQDIDLFRKSLTNFKNMHLKPAGTYYINSKYHTLN